MVNVGAQVDSISVDIFAFSVGRRFYLGLFIGGINLTQEMLIFCAR
ncbi:MAG: hypothetical protein JWO55_93 [Candidatus Saccharibacteria bacterium]|jgi:hypothetical protein|nr:hypothetical protein [Candidatus Saccharibacteria bacterium]